MYVCMCVCVCVCISAANNFLSTFSWRPRIIFLFRIFKWRHSSLIFLMSRSKWWESVELYPLYNLLTSGMILKLSHTSPSVFDHFAGCPQELCLIVAVSFNIWNGYFYILKYIFCKVKQNENIFSRASHAVLNIFFTALVCYSYVSKATDWAQRLSLEEMELVTRVQIVDETVCVSLWGKAWVCVLFSVMGI